MKIIIIVLFILLLLLIIRVVYLRQKINSEKIRAENKELEENGLKESDVPLFGGVISFIIMFLIIFSVSSRFGLKATNLALYIFLILIPYTIYKLLNKKYNSEIINFRQEKAEADEEKRRREIAERMLKRKIELENEQREKKN